MISSEIATEDKEFHIIREDRLKISIEQLCQHKIYHIHCWKCQYYNLVLCTKRLGLYAPLKGVIRELFSYHTDKLELRRFEICKTNYGRRTGDSSVKVTFIGPYESYLGFLAGLYIKHEPRVDDRYSIKFVESHNVGMKILTQHRKMEENELKCRETMQNNCALDGTVNIEGTIICSLLRYPWDCYILYANYDQFIAGYKKAMEISSSCLPYKQDYHFDARFIRDIKKAGHVPKRAYGKEWCCSDQKFLSIDVTKVETTTQCEAYWHL